MPDVAIHASFGGWPGLSHDPPSECGHDHGHFDGGEFRDCPALVAWVRSLDEPGTLRVLSIPDDAVWYVQEYDGFEDIREGRIWTPSGVHTPGRRDVVEQRDDEPVDAGGPDA